MQKSHRGSICRFQWTMKIQSGSSQPVRVFRPTSCLWVDEAGAKVVAFTVYSVKVLFFLLFNSPQMWKHMYATSIHITIFPISSLLNVPEAQTVGRPRWCFCAVVKGSFWQPHEWNIAGSLKPLSTISFLHLHLYLHWNYIRYFCKIMAPATQPGQAQPFKSVWCSHCYCEYVFLFITKKRPHTRGILFCMNSLVSASENYTFRRSLWS